MHVCFFFMQLKGTGNELSKDSKDLTKYIFQLVK